MASTKFTSIMYANGTTLLGTLGNFTSNHTTNSTSNQINAELTRLTDWLAVNKLSLNASNTKIMIFQSKQRTLKNSDIPNIKVNAILIEYVTHFKFLGVNRL